MSKDTRGKAKQWSVVIPKVNEEQMEKLSKLSREEFPFVTFAVCVDDVGNRFIQGFIKSSRRRRLGPIRTLIGPSIITMCPSYWDMIFTIQINDLFYQFGKATSTSMDKFLSKIALPEAVFPAIS